MSRFALPFITLFLFLLPLEAQVQVRPLPREGFEQRIKAFVNNLRIVDTHEHLQNPKAFEKGGMNDFSLLLHHYSDDDIKSGGMSLGNFNALLTDSLSVEQKWTLLKPHWEGASNTAYCRNVLLAISNLFGIDDLNQQTVVPLSNRIKEEYRTPDHWFNTVLKEASKIDFIVIDGSDRSFGNPTMIRYAKRMDQFIFIHGYRDVQKIAQQAGQTVQSLDDLMGVMRKEFKKAMGEGVVAFKSGLAYHRSLDYIETDRQTAQKIFDRMKTQGNAHQMSTAAAKPLQDFLMHTLLAMVNDAEMPFQFHTGLQAGNGNDIRQTNPAPMYNLFMKYPNVKFILFHGGFPYGGEFGTMAKYFRNVYLDLCWLYIISPSYAAHYLNEWLELVPVNKIMAFGGDFHNVEGVYGHQLFARAVIAEVFTRKVASGYFNEEEAYRFAKMILRDNAIRILRLDK